MDSVDDCCVICLDALDNTATSTTECKHVFHTACLCKYVATYNDKNINVPCPICRAPIVHVPTNPSVQCIINHVPVENGHTDQSGSGSGSGLDVFIRVCTSCGVLLFLGLFVYMNTST